MGWILSFSAVFCSWALLRALGSERQKRLSDVARAAAAGAAPSNPPQPRTA